MFVPQKWNRTLASPGDMKTLMCLWGQYGGTCKGWHLQRGGQQKVWYPLSLIGSQNLHHHLVKTSHPCRKHHTKYHISHENLRVIRRKITLYHVSVSRLSHTQEIWLRLEVQTRNYLTELNFCNSHACNHDLEMTLQWWWAKRVSGRRPAKLQKVWPLVKPARGVLGHRPCPSDYTDKSSDHRHRPAELTADCALTQPGVSQRQNSFYRRKTTLSRTGDLCQRWAICYLNT